MTKQPNKLVNVLKIVESDLAAAVEHQFLLVKVSANGSSRAGVLRIIDLFRTYIVDVAPDVATVEVTGSDAKVEALFTTFEPYGMREIVQSGVVAIARGVRSFSK